MLSEKTIREALDYIVENESRLMDAYTAAVRSGAAAEAVSNFRDILMDFLEVRKHLYALVTGINAPSELMQMTGAELVAHFSELDRQ